ncbi:hypothetical protein K7X08_013608 [Anisodus acutangulus]|uniref:LRAT domain-containing protein n=1 Tax=Anisodus acutangulus TaxID=402998 RepID=A0A9Q1LP66_9SOLA|nr:hypothetical protein K7X08_013608 [Anisodus acutangulus]
MYLLVDGFGRYDVIMNNCEDFALYSKTGLLGDKDVGSSGQDTSVISAPVTAIVSLPLKLLRVSSVAAALLTAGMYCLTWKDMGLVSHKIERSELAAGDHIYSWRTLFAYSHHGIYVGGSKVVHFTREQNIVSGDPILFSAPLNCSSPSSTNVSSTCTNIPDCGFQQKKSGVVLSCLDCFLGDGLLYRFDYGASPSVFLTKLRGGTCTTAQSDPPEVFLFLTKELLEGAVKLLLLSVLLWQLLLRRLLSYSCQVRLA